MPLFPDSVIRNSNLSSKSRSSPPSQIRKVLLSKGLSAVSSPIRVPFSMRHRWLSPSQPSRDVPLNREMKPFSSVGSFTSALLGSAVLSLQDRLNNRSTRTVDLHK